MMSHDDYVMVTGTGTLTSGQWRLKRFDYLHEDSRNKISKNKKKIKIMIINDK